MQHKRLISPTSALQLKLRPVVLFSRIKKHDCRCRPQRPSGSLSRGRPKRRRGGRKLRIAPPYSPDRNPIEKMWRKNKAYSRKAKARHTARPEQQERITTGYCPHLSTYRVTVPTYPPLILSGYNEIAFSGPFGASYAGYGNANGDSVYRLREGIERFLITDINNPAASARAQSEIWIMSDKVSMQPGEFNHVPGGANVLYMDGHVAFERYPGQPPVTRSMGALFGALYEVFISDLE